LVNIHDFSYDEQVRLAMAASQNLEAPIPSGDMPGVTDEDKMLNEVLLASI
jgi:hypothetical protein